MIFVHYGKRFSFKKAEKCRVCLGEGAPMRKSTIVAVFFCIAGTAQAGPKRALSAIPRAVGRTAGNMVTFRDRSLALHQWLLVGAALANAGSSIDLYHRCPSCSERDTFFYGSRPSAARLVGLELMGGMAYSTIQQAAWESSYNEGRSREWRILVRWVPTIAPVAGYAWAVYNNARIPSDGSRN